MGVIGYATDWNQTDYTGVDDEGKVDARFIVPLVLQYLTPPVVAIIGLGASLLPLCHPLTRLCSAPAQCLPRMSTSLCLDLRYVLYYPKYLHLYPSYVLGYVTQAILLYYAFCYFILCLKYLHLEPKCMP
ncbi:hypothetical protein EB796_023405 [Bugula neritina]|uniref:Uncharacterized protein n=1 Tax=Bugula neritina TaxID=10212 RepID=A0A7J7IWN3_BUGNE|nr:hypothetical protein EB796_023405 [Bugula neritina]